MTMEQFRSQFQDVWDHLDNILTTKDSEYGSEEDTFATLKQVAKAWGELPRNVALKLALKHYMSLLNEGYKLNDKQIRERINDIHVYLEIAYCNWEET